MMDLIFDALILIGGGLGGALCGWYARRVVERRRSERWRTEAQKHKPYVINEIDGDEL